MESLSPVSPNSKSSPELLDELSWGDDGDLSDEDEFFATRAGDGCSIVASDSEIDVDAQEEGREKTLKEVGQLAIAAMEARSASKDAEAVTEDILVQARQKLKVHGQTADELQKMVKAVLQKRGSMSRPGGESFLSSSSRGNQSFVESRDGEDSDSESSLDAFGEDDDVSEEVSTKSLVLFLRGIKLFREASQHDLEWLAERLTFETIVPGPMAVVPPTLSGGDNEEDSFRPLPSSSSFGRQSAEGSFRGERATRRGSAFILPQAARTRGIVLQMPSAEEADACSRPSIATSSSFGPKPATSSSFGPKPSSSFRRNSGGAPWLQVKDVVASGQLNETKDTDTPDTLVPASSFKDGRQSSSKERPDHLVSAGSFKPVILRIFIDGQAEWRSQRGRGQKVDVGDLLVDLSQLLPGSWHWPSDVTAPHALTPVIVAKVPMDIEFTDRLGGQLQSIADKAGAMIAATRDPARRKVSEVQVIARILKNQHMFQNLPNEAMNAVARSIKLRHLKRGEVLALEGHPTSDLLLSLTSVVTAWRSVPRGCALAAQGRINQASLDRATAAIEKAAKRSPSEGDSSSASEHRKMKTSVAPVQACVGVVLDDSVVKQTEWALGAALNAMASLVVHRSGKALCLSKTDYQRHVLSHRSEFAVQEAIEFLAVSLPRSCRSAADMAWFKETTLARCQTIRSLPPRVRLRLLHRSRLKSLAGQERLCQKGTLQDSCFMLLNGELLSDCVGQTPLKAGAVLGEWVMAQGNAEELWSAGLRAGDEGCCLLEVSRIAFQASAAHLNNAEPFGVVSEIEGVLASPPGKRSLPQLQFLCKVLERHTQYAKLDTYAQLELCQWASHRSLAAGEAVGATANCLCAILSGEIGVMGQRDGSELLILALPEWTFFGEEVGTPDDCLLRATKETSLFYLDLQQTPHAATKPKPGDKAAAAAMERNRAIHALKFKAPHERTSEEVGLLKRLVQNNAFYSQLDDVVREEVCRSITYVEFQAHEPIIKQGDIADVCYIMLKGSAGIWIDTAPKQEQGNTTEEKKDVKDVRTLSKVTRQFTRAISPKSGSGSFRPGSIKGGRQSPSSILLEEPAADEEKTFEIDPETGGPVGAKQVVTLEDGACFGEAGLIKDERRNASIVAKGVCQLGAISKAVFKQILEAAFLEQEQKRVVFIRGCLPKTVSTVDHAQALAGFFSSAQASRGNALCEAGKACERLLLVQEGSCKIFWRREGRAPQEIGEVGTGQFIGLATHVLGDGVEPYSVVCHSTQVKFLRIEANDVRSRLSKELKELLAEVGRQHLDRLQSRVKFLQGAFGQSKKDGSVQVLLDASATRTSDTDNQFELLESPFLCNKRTALLQDGGKSSLMHRFYADKYCDHHERLSSSLKVQEPLVVPVAVNSKESGIIPEAYSPILRNTSPKRSKARGVSRSPSPVRQSLPPPLAPLPSNQESASQMPQQTSEKTKTKLHAKLASAAETASALSPKAPTNIRKSQVEGQHESPRRRRLQKILDKQQQEHDELVDMRRGQGSPKPEQMQDQQLSCYLQVQKKLRETVWDKHAKLLTQYSLDCAAGAPGSIFVPVSEKYEQRKRRQSDAKSSLPIWKPAMPPQEVLKPVYGSSRPSTPRTASSTPTAMLQLQRVMAAPKTPQPRVQETGSLPGEAPGWDTAVLQCSSISPRTPAFTPRPSRSGTPRPWSPTLVDPTRDSKSPFFDDEAISLMVEEASQDDIMHSPSLNYEFHQQKQSIFREGLSQLESTKYDQGDELADTLLQNSGSDTPETSEMIVIARKAHPSRNDFSSVNISVGSFGPMGSESKWSRQVSAESSHFDIAPLAPTQPQSQPQQKTIKSTVVSMPMSSETQRDTSDNKETRPSTPRGLMTQARGRLAGRVVPPGAIRAAAKNRQARYRQ